MSVNFELKSQSREKLGSSESRRIRKSGNIPAVIYGDKDNVYLSVVAKDFEKEYYKGDLYTTIISLDVGGKSQKVITNKIDVDPLNDKPSHITFIKVDEKTAVKAKVRVKFFNKEKSPGIKRGGFLHIVTRKVELLCPVNEIPQELTVDVGQMRVGNKIRSIDIELPENISFAEKNEFNVASIIGRGSKEEEETTAVESEGEVAEGEEAEGTEDSASEGGENSEEKKEDSKE